MPKIKSIEESNIEQRTLDQIVIEVVPSTMKVKHFSIKLEVSLEDEIYLKTYYHHCQDNIQVDETLTEI